MLASVIHCFKMKIMKKSLSYIVISVLCLVACTAEQDNPFIVPTCDDGIQNQDEEGIDCGGRCNACEVIIPVISPCAASLTNNHIKLDGQDIALTAGAISCSEEYSYYELYIYWNQKDITIRLEGSKPEKDAIYPIFRSFDSYDDQPTATVSVIDYWYNYYARSGDIYVTVKDGNVTAEFCSVNMEEYVYGNDEMDFSGRVTCQ